MPAASTEDTGAAAAANLHEQHAVVQNASSGTFVSRLQDSFAALAKHLGATSKVSEQVEALTVLVSALERAGGLLHEAGVKRELSAALGKVLPAAMQLLQAGPADADKAQALPHTLEFMSTALTVLPSSFKQHKALEGNLRALLPSQHCTAHVRVLAGRCLGKLPSCAGTAQAWSEMCHQSLLSVHRLLDRVLMGMETPDGYAHDRAFITPDTKLLFTLATEGAVRSPTELAQAVQQLAAMLSCLQQLLTHPTATAVPVPARAILGVVCRMLAFQECVSLQGKVPTSQEAWGELQTLTPHLHSAALILLGTLVSAAGLSIAPLMKQLAALVSQLLRRAALMQHAGDHPQADSSLQVYKTAGQLLTAGGLGVAGMMAPAVLECVLRELYDQSPVSHQASPAGQKLSGKKRKKRAADDIPTLGLATAALDSVPSPTAQLASLARQTGVLQLLQQLLTVGGAFLPTEQRLKLDAAAAHAASTAASLADTQSRGSTVGEANMREAMMKLRLAAFQALQAAVLSPTRQRSLFLPQAMTLFRQGLHAKDPALVQLSAHALLSCEALLHPRACPPPPAADDSSPDDSHGRAGPSQRLHLGMPTFWRPYSSSVQPSTAVQANTLQHPSVQLASTLQDAVPPLPKITTHITASQQQQQQQQQAGAALQLPPTPHASAQQALRSHEEMQQLMQQLQQQLQQQQQHLMVYGEVLKDQGAEDGPQADDQDALQGTSRPPSIPGISLRQEPQGSGTLPSHLPVGSTTVPAQRWPQVAPSQRQEPAAASDPLHGQQDAGPPLGQQALANGGAAAVLAREPQTSTAVPAPDAQRLRSPQAGHGALQADVTGVVPNVHLQVSEAKMAVPSAGAVTTAAKLGGSVDRTVLDADNGGSSSSEIPEIDSGVSSSDSASEEN